uniref:Uncharacterized protein n=1 Tax=Salarias fasciatus TaxID=181472 RepID=A0A672GGQ0_SALFA
LDSVAIGKSQTYFIEFVLTRSILTSSCHRPSPLCSPGSVYLLECPINHYIPIYLIVVGVFSLVLIWVTLCSGRPEGEGLPTTWNRVYQFCHLLTFLFFLCWFITGNVWIYSIYQPDYNKNTTNIDQYCDKTLYLFAFWTTNLAYILLGLFLVCFLACRFLFGCININHVERPS